MKTIMQKVMLTCRDMEDFMSDYVEGDLDLLTRIQFTMHLAMCGDCRRYLQMYKDSIALGKRIFDCPDDEATGHAPQDMINAILAATEKK